jgi:hypothetical protein
MNYKKISPRVIFILSVIGFGAIMRLLPHWPNFTPIAAMALFGGAYLERKHLAFLIPFAALLLSDIFLGFHHLMIAVYISFALVVGIGIFLRSRVRGGTVILAALTASVLFFLITNFAVWIGSPFYPQNFAGLMLSYTAGLPFLYNGILGDLLYTTLFFGAYYLARQRFPVFLHG